MILLLFVIYVTEFYDNIAVNWNLTSSQYNENGLNKLLTNTLNRYHPGIFYISVVLFLGTSIFYYQSTLPSLMFSPTFFMRRSKMTNWYTIIINLYALWMGSWWALQEGTWGGWWNWDSSETFGLLVTLLILTLTHNSYNLILTSQKFIKSSISYVLFLFAYVFMQLNFELVSHNFGAKFFYFYNNNFFFIEIIVFTNLIAFLIIKLYKFIFTFQATKISLKLSTTKLQNTPTRLIHLIPILIITYSVYASYKPLIAYFLWNFNQINVLNSETFWQPISVTTFLFFGFFLISTSTNTCLQLLNVGIYGTTWLILNFNKLTKNGHIVRIHKLIIIFLIINIWIFYISIDQLTSNSIYSYAIFKNNVIPLSSFSYTLDSNQIELTDVLYLYNQSSIPIWNFTKISNVKSIDCFTLLISHETLINLFRVGLNYSHITISLDIPMTGTLNLLICSILYNIATFVYHTIKKKSH